MFSVTTIPLSTNRPNDMTKENNIIILTVIPKSWSIINEIHIDRGIDKPTKSAFLTPRKNIKTRTTNITPLNILFSKVLTCSFVFWDWLFTIIISMSFGIKLFTSAIAALTLSFNRRRFVPDLFETSTETTGLPDSLV